MLNKPEDIVNEKKLEMLDHLLQPYPGTHWCNSNVPVSYQNIQLTFFLYKAVKFIKTWGNLSWPFFFIMLYNSSKHGAICGIFFLELRLSSNISLKCRVGVLKSTIQWAIPEKIQTRGSWGYTFLKTSLEFFIFLLYPWKFLTKQSSAPEYSIELC